LLTDRKQDNSAVLGRHHLLYW